MFGFGKEKISYLELDSRYRASCMTIRRHVDNLLKNVSEYQENRDIDDDIDIAISKFARSLMKFCLKDEYKELFDSVSTSKWFLDYLDNENKRFAEEKNFLNRYHEIDDIMAHYSRGNLNLSFVTGIMKIIGISEEKIDSYAEENVKHFSPELIQAGLLTHQEFLKNKKILLTPDDKKVIDLLEQILSKYEYDENGFAI